MRTKLFASLLILVFIFVGCGKNNDVVTPPTGGGTNGIGDGTATVTLAGAVKTTFNTKVIFTNTTGGAAILLDNLNGKALLLGSSITTTGTYNIPAEYQSMYTDTTAHYFSDLKSGSVKIDKITNTGVSGSLTGSGYIFDSKTGLDTTKTINFSATFSL